MKVKMIERVPFHMVGAVESHQKRKTETHEERMARHREKMERHQERMHRMKEKAEQKAERVKERAEREVERAKRQAEKAKRDAENAQQQADTAYEKAQNSDYKWEVPNFEGAFNRFGEMMQTFGRHIEKNAKSWDRDIKDFGEKFEERADDFGQKMDVWANEFSEKMDSWGTDFGDRMSQWGDEFGSKMERWAHDPEAKWDDVWEATPSEDERMAKWFDEYPVYKTYKHIYDAQLREHPSVKNVEVFYEVQMLDGGENGHGSMMMVASRLISLEPMAYPAVSMTFDPDKWLVAKLTEEEYGRDWLKRLEELDMVEGYEIEPYFIVKHRFEKRDELIKIYCPLKVKDNA